MAALAAFLLFAGCRSREQKPIRPGAYAGAPVAFINPLETVSGILDPV